MDCANCANYDESTCQACRETLCFSGQCIRCPSGKFPSQGTNTCESKIYQVIFVIIFKVVHLTVQFVKTTSYVFNVMQVSFFILTTVAILHVILLSLLHKILMLYVNYHVLKIMTFIILMKTHVKMLVIRLILSKLLLIIKSVT